MTILKETRSKNGHPVLTVELSGKTKYFNSVPKVVQRKPLLLSFEYLSSHKILKRSSKQSF